MFQSTQYRDRLVYCWLGHENRLEATCQCCVFLDVLTILVERRCPTAVQFATRQCWFEHIGSVHRPFRFSRTDQCVKLVDEQNGLPRRSGYILENCLQALFELAAKLGPRNQRPKVQRNNGFVANALGNISRHDPHGNTLCNRGLPDASLHTGQGQNTES